jgi:cobalt-zinc-cadmium efflux system outer membrane protein
MFKNMYTGRALIGVALLLAGNQLRAESSQALSSETAVELAITNNPWLKAAQSVVAQAEGRQLQAGRWDNPELSVDYASDQSFNNEGEQNFGLAFSQRFPITRRLQLEKENAQIEVALAHAEIGVAKRQLTQDVKLAIVALAVTEAELKLRHALAELNQEFSTFIESRVHTGEASQIEADQLRLTLYATRQEARHLEHRQAIQKAELRTLMGVPAEYRFCIDYKLKQSIPRGKLPEFEDSQLHAHPAYQAKKLLLELAESAVDITRAARWADIAIELSYEEERGVDAPDGLGRDRFFGIGLSVPLPIIDRKQGELAERQAMRTEMHWQLQAVASKLRIEARLQRELVHTLKRQALEYESKIIPLVERNLAAIKEGYTNGQVGITELFQTQSQALKIESTHIEMLSELASAHIRWSAATGQ